MRVHQIATAAVALGAALLCPTFAHAQFSAFETAFERITDVNFYAGSNLSSGTVGSGELNVSLFGVELLYNLGTAHVRTNSDTTVTTRKLTGVEVTWTGDRADSTHTYQVDREDAPGRPVLDFELGLGYGQISTLNLHTSGYRVNGSVRELPAASLYATHIPTALYAGLRSGLIQTSNLQAYDADGVTLRASGTAFQGGMVVGIAPDAFSIFPFAEIGWVYRTFGSLDWSGDTVPPELPRRLDVGGWQLVVGIQTALQR